MRNVVGDTPTCLVNVVVKDPTLLNPTSRVSTRSRARSRCRSGGIETTLIFHRGLDLPEFAAFDLLKDEAGTEEMRYFVPYLELAREQGVGFVLESPTWRASPRWGEEIGYGEDELDQINRRAISLMAELRDHYADDVSPIASRAASPSLALE